jgi:hypothetical protein
MQQLKDQPDDPASRWSMQRPKILMPAPAMNKRDSNTMFAETQMNFVTALLFKGFVPCP